MLTNFEKQEIQRSPILAKAVLRRPNGLLDAIVVFAASTRYEFYWKFRLRSPRAPRRAWRLIGAQMRPTTNVGTRPDFREYADNQALLAGAEVISLRTPGAKRLQTLMTMNDLAFDRMTAGPQRDVQPWEADKLNRKFRSHLRGGAAFTGW